MPPRSLLRTQIVLWLVVWSIIGGSVFAPLQMVPRPVWAVVAVAVGGPLVKRGLRWLARRQTRVQRRRSRDFGPTR